MISLQDSVHFVCEHLKIVNYNNRKRSILTIWQEYTIT